MNAQYLLLNFNRSKILYFQITHNTPYFFPNVVQNIVFQTLLEGLRFSKSIWKKKCKIIEGQIKYIKCVMGDSKIVNTRAMLEYSCI